MAVIAKRVVVIALLAGTAISAQQTPVFRTGVDLVRIDVSVLDASGRPVHGLTTGDFTLLEDGTPQTIEAISEVNVPDADDGPPWVRDVAPDVRSNTAEDGRLLIFLLDDALTPTGEKTRAMTETVKRIANTVIDQLGPTDLAAVLFTWQNKRDAQDFTNDHNLLHVAVNHFVPKNFQAGPGGARYDWPRVSYGVAESVVKFLADLPGRRKALIYVTPELPTRNVDRQPDGGFVTTMGTEVRDYHVWGAIDESLRSKVTVYGISPTGLEALSKGDPALLMSTTSASAGGRGSPPLTARPKSIAADTGGFNIGSPSQFAEGVTRILRETGSYYVLGYRSTNAVSHSPFHAVDVRVAKPGLVVQSHPGYLVPKPEKAPKKPAPGLTVALAGVLPKADLPLRVTAAPFAVAGKSDADVAIVLGVQEPMLPQRTSDHVDMQVRAFTFHGDPRGMTEHHLDVFVPPGTAAESYVELLSHLRLKPGRYELRLSARSGRLDQDGSAYLDLEVPDFAKAPVSLSGVAFSMPSRPGAGPADALASFLPVVPTTERTFGRIDRVSVFLRVYEGGKKLVAPVALTVRVLDDRNAPAVNRTETIEPARFGSARAADYRLDLPLAELSAGRHLLTIEAKIGPATARRDVRFTVREP